MRSIFMMFFSKGRSVLWHHALMTENARLPLSRPLMTENASLFAPLTTFLPPKIAGLFKRCTGGDKVVDALLHLPTHGEEHHILTHLHEALAYEKGTRVVLSVTIQEHYPARSSRSPYRIRACDTQEETLELVFFHGRAASLRHRFPIGHQRILRGTIEASPSFSRMIHPESLSSFPSSCRSFVEPIYPLTAGLPNRTVGLYCRKLLACLPDLPEWIPEALRQRFQWPAWKTAIKSLHEARTLAVLNPRSPARQRLFFDELFAHQLAWQVLRQQRREEKGRVFPPAGALREQWLRSLPFTLTTAQTKALQEIDADLSSSVPMERLLQGEVGSGKTLVALGAILRVLDAGVQAALLAPTEVLARQHYVTCCQWLPPSLSCALLVGEVSAAERRAQRHILQDLSSGKLPFIIGTHALLAERVVFHDLGLVVIDEQQRFGVRQCQELVRKGTHCDVLYLSATPIPRTLLLTEYGDLAVSFLQEKPANRPPVVTCLQPLSQVDEVITRLQERLSHDQEQAFWVCPLVEESEKLDLTAAEERFAHLQKHFGLRVGLLHGRLSSEEKRAVLEAFREGKCALLVTTTVIEVGIDIPSATLMIIEHAERFGLAQLHQLRGRVGRGTAPAVCLLLYARPLSPIAMQRLSFFKKITEGAVLAEKDLHLRGGGDVSGVKQSGFHVFRLGDVWDCPDLLEEAHHLAQATLAQNPRFYENPQDPCTILCSL
ncbi:MAG: ATP-dependent DNA helicase RecG, partial [Holosporales bacterium]|nr:ATP-dependent DNA helicase RecG [Holosporales bacterium]